jgi:hypothetical protein
MRFLQSQTRARCQVPDLWSCGAVSDIHEDAGACVRGLCHTLHIVALFRLIMGIFVDQGTGASFLQDNHFQRGTGARGAVGAWRGA